MVFQKANMIYDSSCYFLWMSVKKFYVLPTPLHRYWRIKQRSIKEEKRFMIQKLHVLLRTKMFGEMWHFQQSLSSVVTPKKLTQCFYFDIIYESEGVYFTDTQNKLSFKISNHFLRKFISWLVVSKTCCKMSSSQTHCVICI